MDQFPSAFERFEDTVDVRRFPDYARLRSAFADWAGFRWIDSMEQNRALRREALKRGIPFREEIATRRLRYLITSRRSRKVFDTETGRWRWRFGRRKGQFARKPRRRGR